MLPGLTLVVSPLISLMQDQLKKLPLELPGACFSGGMSAFQVSQLCLSVLEGHIKVLYVSPERLCTQSFRNLIRAMRNKIPDNGALALGSASYSEVRTSSTEQYSTGQGAICLLQMCCCELLQHPDNITPNNDMQYYTVLHYTTPHCMHCTALHCT